MAEKMWMVRAGQSGRLFQEFEDNNWVAIGWNRLNDLSKIENKNELRKLLKNNYPKDSNRAFGKGFGQIGHFIFDIKIGDYVITYSQETRFVLVGKITSEYKYIPNCPGDYNHIKKVRWLGKVKRDDLSKKNRSSITCGQTIFKVPEQAKQQILKLLKTKPYRPTKQISIRTYEDKNLRDKILKREKRMTKKKVNKKKSKKGQLVCQHLENISSRALEDYASIIKKFIKGKSGVYALYKRDKLYYIGLTLNLKNRLSIHLRDRHKKKWDKFSIYLTKKQKHLKELESLVIRITYPKGNKKRGKFIASTNLNQNFKRNIKEYHKLEEDSIFLDRKKILSKKTKKRNLKKRNKIALALYVSKRFKIRMFYKGKTYKAQVLKSGKIKYKKLLFNSPSAIAKVIRKKQSNGWNWWKYQKSQGNWVPLKELRK